MTFVDYECKHCGRTKKDFKYDFLKDIKAEIACECGKNMVRDYGKVGMHFKGAGFFNSSYKGK